MMKKNFALLWLSFMVAGVTMPVTGQTYYDMSLGNYLQEFTGWTNPAGAVNWSGVAINATGTIPSATRTTVSSAGGFSAGTSGGIQRDDTNSSTKIYFLTTGSSDNSSSLGLDLNLNFSGRNAGNLTFDAETVFNSTGNRVGTLRVYYTTDAGATWAELTGNGLPYAATNNVAGSAAVSVTLPTTLNNQSAATFRFYYHNGTGGSTGSRPKISIDNVAVTSADSGAGPSTNVSFTASSAAVEENVGTYAVTVTKSLAAGDISGQIQLGGTASLGSDYSIDTTNFVMNGATTSATFTITIVDDVDQELNETISLVLTNVTGATITPPSTFTLTINKNDVPPLPPPVVWINEVNYDPFGTDSNEYVEVAGPANTDLTAYQLHLYNGGTGSIYTNILLSGLLDDEGCGYGSSAFLTPGIQNGFPDGIALSRVDGGVTSLVQFISYEGLMDGVGGIADGVTSSQDIGSQTSVDLSLQLAGTGTNYAAFTWVTNSFSQGSLNILQTISPCTPAAPTTNVSFTVGSASISETGGTYVLTVAKTRAEGDISGEIAIGGTATQAVHYSISGTNFTMNGAVTSATFTVTIVDNATDEPNRTVALTLTNVVGAGVISPSVFTLTILDDDLPPPPANAIAYYSFTENSSNAAFVAANASASAVSISTGTFSVSSGSTAFTNTISGVPYAVSAGGWSNFSSQIDAKEFAVSLTTSPGYMMTVTNISFYFRATAQGPSGIGATINGSSAFSTNAGDGIITTISLPLSTSVNITSLLFAIQGWTNGSRATTGSGELQIDDILVQGFVTQTNAAPAPDVSFTLSSDTNSEAAGVYEVTVTKSPASGDVSGSITLGGTATEGSDYTVGTTNFTMNGPSTSAVFAITILNDSAVESSETIVMTLTNVTGGNIISPSVFTLTITDNDVFTPPTPSATNRIVSITSSGGNITAVLQSSDTNFQYNFHYYTSLFSGPPTVLTTSNGTGSSITFVDVAPTNSMRVYGVEAFYPLPP